MQEYVDVAQANRHWSISAHHDKLPVQLVKSWKQGLTHWLIEKKNKPVCVPVVEQTNA